MKFIVIYTTEHKKAVFADSREEAEYKFNREINLNGDKDICYIASELELKKR